jgi:predicted transcriptional regulator
LVLVLDTVNTPLLAARVDPELVAQLDALAASTGTTRSDLVRDGIRRVLAAADNAVKPAEQVGRDD